MRIAISTDGGFVSQHFGRCPHFTLIDIVDGKTLNKEIIENPGHEPGYIPQFLRKKGVKKIICGGMGVRAQGFFEEMGIEAVMGIDGSIDEVVKKLENGMLESSESLCNPGAGKGYGVEKTACDHDHDQI